MILIITVHVAFTKKQQQQKKQLKHGF